MGALLGATFALTLILCLDSGRAAETSSENEIVAAVYQQLFRHVPGPEGLWNYAYELERGTTVKDIVMQMCSREEFVRIVTQESTDQALITCFDRILGRPPTTEELQRYTKLLAESGWQSVISALVESSEYKLSFGDFTVPHRKNDDSKLLTYKRGMKEHDVIGATATGSSSSGRLVVPVVPILPPILPLDIPKVPELSQFSGGLPKRSQTDEEEMRLPELHLHELNVGHAHAAEGTPVEKGNIAFNTPDSMTYGETKTIQLLLDVSKSGRELEEKIIEEGSRVHADQIQISDQMEANLTGDAFDITPITSARQMLSKMEATEWRWDVRAKRFSSQRLHLSLNAIIVLNGKEVPTKYRVFDRDILVRVTGLHSAALLAEDNWQVTAAISTATLGVIGWVLKKLFSKHGTVTA